jgi:hypothetical protein
MIYNNKTSHNKINNICKKKLNKPSAHSECLKVKNDVFYGWYCSTFLR